MRHDSWFDIIKEGIKTWEDFETQLRERFINTPEHRERERAKVKLRQLIIKKGEPHIDHLEKCLKLCREVDDKVEDSEVIRRVTRALGSEHAMMLAGIQTRTVEGLRESLTYLDATLPLRNSQPDREAALNAVRGQ